MTKSSFVTVFQAWMRSRGLKLSDGGLVLSEEGERLALADLCDLLRAADAGVHTRQTRQIDPEKLHAALAASEVR